MPHQAVRSAMLCALLLSALSVLAEPALALCNMGWLSFDVANPGNRRGSCMVYDSIRNRMVLFGGHNQIGQIQGDTWEWTGSAWTQVATTGPAPRAYHSMAFDSRRGVVVLFGGNNSEQSFGDTWEWDGTSWTLVFNTGPAGHVSAGMTFDEARGVTVLYGGSSIGGDNYGETWTWNGLSWTFQADASPGPRATMKLSYDPVRQVTVMYGGRGNTSFSDTWEWDGGQWFNVPVAGPGKRMDYCLAYDPCRGATLLYGGHNGLLPYFDDAWEWNGTSWTLVSSGGPGGRAFAAMGYNTAQQAMMLYGGTAADPTRTWVWLGPAVQITSPPGPLAVSCGADAAFGVAATGPGTLTYQWRRNGVALTDNGRITGSTTASLSLSPTVLADQGSYDVLVGSTNGSLASPVAALTVSPASLPITQQPSAQSVTCGQPATFSVATSGTPPLTYQWRRFGVALTNNARISGATSATLTIDPTVAADAGQYSVVITSGCASATSNTVLLGVSGGLPVFTLQPTDQASSCGQGVSFTAATTGGTFVAWQRAGDGVFLVDDGRISGSRSFTLTIDPVLPSDVGVYVATVANECGQDNSNGAALTIPSSTPVITQQPTRSVAALGASATFTVVAAGGSQQLTYQWRRGGVALADGGNVAGTTTPTLTIDPVSQSDVGAYDVLVSNTCGATPSSALPLLLEGCDAFWQQVATSGPGARRLGSMVYDSGRNRVVLFGGADPVGHILGDTWEWDGTAWTQVATTGPPPRTEFAMSYDSGRGKVVVYGGATSEYLLDDTWEWDGTTWSQVATQGPGSRFTCSMAYHAATGVTLLFGGMSGDPLGDTWKWDGTSWTLLPVASPPARAGARMVYDSARQRIVLHGGVAQFLQTDTWEWDGTSWIDRGVTGPPGRQAAGMAYDVARAVTILYGGGNGSNFRDDTWEWDGVQWSQGSTSGPGARIHMYIAHDGNGVPIMLGGTPAGYDGKTWSLASPPNASFTTQPANQTTVAGQPATFSVTTLPSTGLEYQWSRGGTPLADGGNISGATSPTLTVSAVSAADEGYYSVTVSTQCGTSGSAAGRLRVVCGSAPTISQQPADLVVPIAGPASWNVVASGCVAPSYQWRKNGVPIPGATSAGYSIASVGAGDAGLYSVQVSAGGLTAVSREATLNVNPGPVFVSYSAQAPDPNGVQVSWTLRDPALVRVEYGATAALGLTLSAAASGTSGTLLVPRGNQSAFYYRLVAVDGFNLTAATSVAQVIFPASVYKLGATATSYPYSVSFNGAGLGAKITITATNQGNVPIGGFVRVTAAKFGNAIPRLLTNQTALPFTIANGIALGGSASGDLLFKKSEIGSPAGRQVTFTATIVWAETAAPNSPTRTITLNQRVKVPQ